MEQPSHRKRMLVTLCTAIVIGLMAEYGTQFASERAEPARELAVERTAVRSEVANDLEDLTKQHAVEILDREALNPIYGFLREKKQELLDSGAKFLEANLSTMSLRYFEGGEEVFALEIKTKGREGSWWETPIGLYSIQTKEPDHFSSFGHVHMPWSMHFHGNFFIHGRPYYPGGEPVPEGFSGGCIRLTTEDAATLFEQVEIGMSLIVVDDSIMPEHVRYAGVETVEVDPVSANSYVVADLGSGYVFDERNADTMLPIASITKLMSVVVALEHINLEKFVTVPSEALVYTSRPRLVAGDRMQAYELIYPILTESSNEAAITLAYYFGREHFVRLMNEKAQALGMHNTTFVDSTGAGEGNVSTAKDLVILAKYLLEYRPYVFSISAGRFGTNSFYGEPTMEDLGNFNLFAEDPDFVGGKTGLTTAAGQTMLAVFTKDMGGERRPIAVVVLGSEDTGGAVQTLLNGATERYRLQPEPIASAESIE